MFTSIKRQHIEFPEQDSDFAMSLWPTTEELLKELGMSIEDDQYEIVDRLCSSLNFRYLGWPRFLDDRLQPCTIVSIDTSREATKTAINNILVKILSTDRTATHPDQNQTMRSATNAWFTIVQRKLEKRRAASGS